MGFWNADHTDWVSDGIALMALLRFNFEGVESHLVYYLIICSISTCFCLWFDFFFLFSFKIAHCSLFPVDRPSTCSWRMIF